MSTWPKRIYPFYWNIGGVLIEYADKATGIRVRIAMRLKIKR
jgi:hypothetical protein